MAKILLVDDAAFMRKVVRDTLSKNGYNDLYEAVDGADAVEKYTEISPDLVIMDITMQSALKMAAPMWLCVQLWARRLWLLKLFSPAPRILLLNPLSRREF